MNKNHQDLSATDHTPSISLATIHSDLLATKDLVYSPCSFECSQLLVEAQNAEYGAYVYQINALAVRFRSAKITPTKVGQFVTLWERSEAGPIQPYDLSNSVDLFVISVRKDDNFGQFVFPKAVLCDHDIVSINGQGGKRAFRVYPPWDKPTSRQAQKTQNWQLDYFLEVPENGPINRERIQMLYGLQHL